MKGLIIFGIINALNILASFLEGKDDNEHGVDDAIAYLCAKVSELLAEYQTANTINKKIIVIALDAVQGFVEKIDEGWDGIDDKIAEKIGKLKAILES